MLSVIQRLYRSAKYGAITCLLIFRDETGRSYVSLDFEGLSKLICKTTSSGKTGLRKKECMTEEPEVWGTWAVGGIEEARVGPTSTK